MCWVYHVVLDVYFFCFFSLLYFNEAILVWGVGLIGGVLIAVSAIFVFVVFFTDCGGWGGGCVATCADFLSNVYAGAIFVVCTVPVWVTRLAGISLPNI
jgi:hypothetical protein